MSTTMRSVNFSTIAVSVVAGAVGYFVAKKLAKTLWCKLHAKGNPLPAPPGHWLTGSIPQIAKRLSAFPEKHIDTAIMDLMETYPYLGKLWRLQLVALDFVVVVDPDALKEVLSTKNYPKSPTYDGLTPFLGRKSMVVANGAVWAKQRKAFNPGFHFMFLKNLVPVFVDKTELLCKRLDRVMDAGSVVQLHDEMTLLTMDVICEVALSTDFGFLTSSQPPPMFTHFMQLLYTVSEHARRPDLTLLRYLPWVYLRWRTSQHVVDSTLLRVIKRRLAANGVEGGDAKAPKQDILGLALQTAAESGEGRLDMEEVLSQVKTFLFAGHDTTASTVSWIVYELSQHPEVERLLVEELDRVLGARAPSADDLSQLKYMAVVVKEALRLWGPGGAARMAGAGTTLQGYDIGGKVLYCPHYAIHRNKDAWGPDADEFRPERWLDEAYVAALHPFAYQPFSKGTRDCIGQTFALLEIKAVLAILYQRYRFEYAGTQPEELAYQITSHPRFKVPVRVHARQRAPTSQA